MKTEKRVFFCQRAGRGQQKTKTLNRFLKFKIITLLLFLLIVFRLSSDSCKKFEDDTIISFTVYLSWRFSSRHNGAISPQSASSVSPLIYQLEPYPVELKAVTVPS